MRKTILKLFLNIIRNGGVSYNNLIEDIGKESLHLLGGYIVPIEGLAESLKQKLEFISNRASANERNCGGEFLEIEVILVFLLKVHFFIKHVKDFGKLRLVELQKNLVFGVKFIKVEDQLQEAGFVDSDLAEIG